MTSRSQSPLRPNAVFARRYLIDHLLGEGAMGTVAAARDLVTGGRVAIKCLHSMFRGEPAVVARFQREARATERLRSEHVARVFASGEEACPDGGPPVAYLIMEHLEGQDLRSLLTEQGPLSPGRAAELARQACLGLAEAHALGIVHRDLKPSNLFSCRGSDGGPLVKVLDFGIARFQTASAAGDERDVTECAATLGSIHFMAPEQLVDARSVDGRADVWSLGVTLYELVAGAKPFSGSLAADIAYEILVGKPLPLAAIAPRVPAGLSAVVMRCLERRREDRWPSMVELSRALAPFAERPASPLGEQLALRTVKLPQDILRSLRGEEEAEGPPTRRPASA